MTELLKLAEAYYTVAADLRRQANQILATAALLDTSASRMCEENMRREAKAEAAPSPPSAGGNQS